MSTSPAPARFRDPSTESMGARSFACDFQVHAPPDWRNPASKSTEDFIAEEYLPRLFASGRQVVGVPQHNSIVHGGARLVRDMAQRLRAGGRTEIPVVFPGYELTSSDQLQVILLTNPDEEDLKDLDTRVHHSLRLGLANKRWHESELNLEQLLAEVRQALSQRLVALVVATGHKGMLQDGDAVTRNRDSYRKALGLADGMILAGRLAECHDRAQRLLLGNLPDYRCPRAGYVQSSDARSFEELANASLSYVKLGSFSVEGLRQALLNCATFTSDTPFSEPSILIERLRVRESVFFDEIDVEPSRHLTSLIGGRGTGKSCLLEYVAHVCEYQRSGQYDRPNAQILVLRKEGSTEGTILPSTTIELHVRVGEKRYRFERAAMAATRIFECADERYEGGVPIDGASAAGLINLRLFGQRELANIVRHPSFFSLDPSQREGINLFSFLKSDQLSEVSRYEREAAGYVDDIKKLSIDLASSARALAERPQLVSERERLLQDLEKMKKRAAHPAFQAHRDFLQLAASRDAIFRSLDEIEQAQNTLASTTMKILAKTKEPAPSTSTGAEESLRSLQTAAVAQTEEFMATLTEVKRSWEHATTALRASTEYQLISEASNKHVKEYDAAKREVEAQNINLALLEPLQKRIMDLDSRLATFAELDEKVTECRKRRRLLVQQLRDARRAQGDIYIGLAQQLTASTKERVRMTVVRAGDVTEAISEFQTHLKDKRRFTRADVRELAETLHGRVEEGAPGLEPAELWTELVDHLVASFEVAQDELLGRAQRETPLPDLPWIGAVGNKLKEVVTTQDDEQIGVLICQHVPDAARIELRRHVDADDYIPLSHASVGQKATALFLILLAQTDGLLVIDQPEDDLDNAFITKDILPALQDLKHKQQIVFATHNANMLVNAESEKIVVLDTEPRTNGDPSLPTIRGRIEHQGGIDQVDVRDCVTTILEGGRDAFLARERKYRFAEA